MKVNVKPGVIFKELNARLFHVCITATFVWEKYQLIPTITSANDSIHCANSLHYKNLAWDLRIWGLPDPQKVADELRDILNIKSNDYDVIYGDPKHLDHIHVEYDPKENDSVKI